MLTSRSQYCQSRHALAAGVGATVVLLAACGQSPTVRGTTEPATPSPAAAASTPADEASAAEGPKTAEGCDERAYEMANQLAPDDLEARPVLESAYRSTAKDARAWQSAPVEDTRDDGVPAPQPDVQPWLRDVPDGRVIFVCTYGAESFAAPNREGGKPYTHFTLLMAEGGEPEPYRAWPDSASPGAPAPDGAEQLSPDPAQR